MTVGSDYVDVTDPYSYVTPMSEYNWTVIAYNENNENCDSATMSDCDDTDKGWGWSSALQITQSNACPDTPTLGVVELTVKTCQRWKVSPQPPPTSCRNCE